MRKGLFLSVYVDGHHNWLERKQNLDPMWKLVLNKEVDLGETNIFPGSCITWDALNDNAK